MYSIEFSDFTDTRFEKKIIQKCVLEPLPLLFLSKNNFAKKFWIGVDLPPSCLDNVCKYTVFIFWRYPLAILCFVLVNYVGLKGQWKIIPFTPPSLHPIRSEYFQRRALPAAYHLGMNLRCGRWPVTHSVVNCPSKWSHLCQHQVLWR